ncbi:hypothetical protein DL96DRAFT_117560 [Flagelloscypha sp. PMI_526]|nr:hypothetical protein DL96DRAFT_117560 [Flagelloscypha sp. PMI_526]
MALPPADPKFFETFFEPQILDQDATPINTVNVVSLTWLEDTASRAVTRSPFWNITTLSVVNVQSKLYLESLESSYDGFKDEELALEKMKTAKSRLLRSISASQTLISLRETATSLLPEELTYYIFQFVANQGVLEAKQLALLARPVQRWVDPYIFKRTIPLDDVRYNTLANLQTPRLVQAKKEYFIALTFSLFSISDNLQFLHIWNHFPAVRSISCPGRNFVQSMTETASPTALRRLQLIPWDADLIPLSSQIFRTLTHLSLEPDSDIFRYTTWNFAPLKHLLNLTHFFFHTHSDMIFYPNEVNADHFTRFLRDNLVPSLPLSLQLLIWVTGTVLRDGSFAEYKSLLDGTLDSRLVLAFRKGDDTSATFETSEDAGIGSMAYVYPASSVGLDWLECLWEDVKQFMAEKSAMRLDAEDSAH